MSTITKTQGPAVLRGVTYDVYTTLRDDPRNDHLRLTYHDGVLEIMSPQYRHERGQLLLAMIVRAYAASTGLECLGSGSTTFRKGLPGQLKGKGKEPDQSFYFRNLEIIRPKHTIDLTIDPPPDLWIEVDNRASSAGKLPIYAALGVAEVWRYRPRRRRLWMGRLVEGSYQEIEESQFLDGITPSLLLGFLDETLTRGETAWDVWLRAGLAERAAEFIRRRAERGAS